MLTGLDFLCIVGIGGRGEASCITASEGPCRGISGPMCYSDGVIITASGVGSLSDLLMKRF
jgi:hypothetical protein